MPETQRNIKSPVELLSPAPGLLSGMAAIRAGADAVYIGGPDFGARHDAANTVDDIESLARYAHSYGARVYLALNTIIFDSELKQAERLARRAWEIGVDALIVQDMAFAMMDLPPIELHASTQTFNIAPERVKFLEDAGFARVILERGATLDRIRAIRRTTSIELEVFVHGAICVSYSGQCYLGQAVCGRGGNRGACAQPCRARYDLTDAAGGRLIADAHILSVADLNLGGRLEELIDAGVGSLKIEGRLKDESYIVNNTAYYSEKLNRLAVPRTSSGRAHYDFEPDPMRSFSRGFTEYFLDGPAAGTASGDTAKATGEFVGTVSGVGSEYFELDKNAEKLNSGDGICFTMRDGRVIGTNVNGVSGNRVHPNKMSGIVPGSKIYRNFDRLFQPSGSSAERSIDVRIDVSIDKGGIALTATDSDGTTATVRSENGFETARNGSLAEKTIKDSLSKSGGTIFRVEKVNIEASGELPFIPASTINGFRRELLDKLHRQRIARYVRRERTVAKTPPVPYPAASLDYRANVANRLAREFYEKHGVKDIGQALELQDPTQCAGREVMRTPYCVRRETGCCLVPGKFGTAAKGKFPAPDAARCAPGPLYLENNGMRLELRFDCQACEMSVIFLGNDR